VSQLKSIPGERVRYWFQDKKTGWYALLEDPKMPAMRTVLDQARNAIDRKLCAMQGFHHPGGSQAAFLMGLAHLYNLIPYQRRAKMQVCVRCKPRVDACRRQTGCPTCKSTPRATAPLPIPIPSGFVPTPFPAIRLGVGTPRHTFV